MVSSFKHLSIHFNVTGGYSLPVTTGSQGDANNGEPMFPPSDTPDFLKSLTQISEGLGSPAALSTSVGSPDSNVYRSQGQARTPLQNGVASPATPQCCSQNLVSTPGQTNTSTGNVSAGMLGTCSTDALDQNDGLGFDPMAVIAGEEQGNLNVSFITIYK